MFRGGMQDESVRLQAVPAEQLATLLKVGTALAHSLELDVVLQTAVESACRVTLLDSAAIYLLDSGDVLRLHATWPVLPDDFPEHLRYAPLVDHPHIAKALADKRLYFFDDIRSEVLTPAERLVTAQRNLVSILYVPFSGPAVTGIFLVASCDRVQPLGEADIALCETLSTMVGLAVNNAKMFESLRKSKSQVECAYADSLYTREQLRALTMQMTLAEERQRRDVAHELRTRIVEPLEHLEARGGVPSAQPSPSSGSVGVGSLIAAAAEEARRIASEMSPPQIFQVGLAPALTWLCDRARARGITCETVAESAVENLDEDVALFIFQAARELIDNATEHADSHNITVSVTLAEGSVQLRVTDDGRGFPTSDILLPSGDRSKFGLFSLKERAEYLGGSFEVISAMGVGTNALVRIPLAQSAAKRTV